jgi:hypothetical protein
MEVGGKELPVAGVRGEPQDRASLRYRPFKQLGLLTTNRALMVGDEWSKVKSLEDSLAESGKHLRYYLRRVRLGQERTEL